MINNDLRKPGLSRRDLLSTAAAATGALVVSFWMPQRATAQKVNPAGAAWATEPAVDEINAWVVVAPDDTVTIRIAQTELGQGVWTSNAMMVCGVAMRLEQSPAAICFRQSRRPGNGAGMDARRYGQGRH